MCIYIYILHNRDILIGDIYRTWYVRVSENWVYPQTVSNTAETGVLSNGIFGHSIFRQTHTKGIYLAVHIKQMFGGFNVRNFHAPIVRLKIKLTHTFQGGDHVPDWPCGFCKLPGATCWMSMEDVVIPQRNKHQPLWCQAYKSKSAMVARWTMVQPFAGPGTEQFMTYEHQKSTFSRFWCSL